MTVYDEILADNPYAWYRFENTAQLGAVSGTGTTMTLNTGTAVTSVAGSSGISALAAQFPAAANSYMSKTALGTESIMRPQTAMSVEVWFKRTVIGTTSMKILAARNSGGYINLGIAPSNAAAPLFPEALFVENVGSTGTTTRITSAAAAITDTNWHHAVLTSTGTTLSLYLDGVLIGTGSAQGINTNSGSTQEFWIGNGSTTAALAAGAILDEVAVYKTTLSATRVQAHYNAAVPPGISISTQAPAIAVNITAPAPVVKAVKNARIVAPAVTLTTASPAPVVTAVDSSFQTLGILLDSNTNQTHSLSGVGPSSTGYIAKFQTATFPAGQVIGDARLILTATGGDGGWITIYRNTSDYSGGSTPTRAAIGQRVLVAGGAGAKSINISSIAEEWRNGAPNYGIWVEADYTGVGTILTFATDTNPTVSSRPKITIDLDDVPVVPAVIQAPAMTVDITAPHGHGISTGNRVIVPAASLSISGAAPVVSAQRNLKFSIPAMTLTQLFPGGSSVTPDVTAKVVGPVAEYYFSTPDAKQYIEVPSINQVPAMEIGIEAPSDITLNFNTDRKVKVNNAMSMTTRLVGIYNAEADRYITLVDKTVDFNDIWLPLDDVSGDVARDLAYYKGPGTPEPGVNPNNPASYYRGSPQLAVDGPYLRKAVRFDGVDDYLRLQYTELFPNKVNFEFSIRTTQQNGTILSGGGSNLPVANLVADNQAQIRLVDGKIALFPGNGTGSPTYVTNAYVADGEWHHVVINIPWMNNTGFYGDAYTYVAVDGKVKWTRFYNAIGFFRPLSAMGAVSVDANGTETVTRAIAGDMSHLIIRDQRDLGQSMPTDLALKLYYEWSNATLIQPEPMVVNLSMPAPHRARGNRKKMIVLMGLPNGGFNTPESAFTETYNYWSIFAGYYVGIEDMPGFTRTGPDVNRRMYYPVAPFVMEDYMCYPVAVYSDQNGSGSIQLSAEGMEKPGIRDPLSRVLIDDETGLPRFIDLQNDLNEPIENFDAITALNYPAEEPTWDANTWGGTSSRTGTYYDPKQFTRLTATQWKVARDKLRDSILDASYNGVNLWINEPQMAKHLGFIDTYDIHAPGYIGQEPTKANPFAERGLTYAPAAYEETVFNRRGDVLDAAHVTAGSSYVSGPTQGWFFWIWQIDAKRVITATEPGLTDLPGAFIKDQIDFQSKDRWQPHSRITAYDVLKRENGLQVGDTFQMPMTIDPTSSGTAGWGYMVGIPRRYVVSARPQGIAGKVISKEIDFYYGANGIVVANPFAGNVITIAAERGTVVRGRPIMGRAFIEFMSPDTQQEVINVDADKSMWGGDTGKNITTWDFDTRRYRETISKSIVNLTSRTIKVDSNGGTSIVEKSGSREIQWYEKQVSSLVMLPYMSMNARGLHWLGLSESIPAGTIRAFATPMEITLNAPAPKLVRTGGAVSKVVGPMRVDIDLRQPKNYRGADYSEKALPMVLNITMPGIGKVIKAPAMELNITAPTSVRAIGSGDRIFVYMDAGTNVTLFIEEK